jgi:SAM-dependent methyltransferase
MIGALLTPLFYKRATYGYGDRFPRFVQAGNALEIGCGNGAYLSYLKYHGWNVQGIDLSPHAAAAAKQRFDIEVFVGTLDRAPLKSGSFDYVHLSHVLEHFFDPIDSLRNIFTLLRPGGRIYIEVPNAASFGAKLNGEFWYGWDAPRHLFTFTPETLKASLAFTGFEVTKMCSIFVETNRWAATFRRENLSGEMEDHRPTAGDEDLRSRLSSWLTTCLSPLSGDFLSCWATKS